MNVSRNSTSIPFSFSRENPISKDPVAVMQRDASATTVAVHLRSSVGGRIGENATSLTAKVGLQVGWPLACVAPMSPRLPARSAAMQDRYATVGEGLVMLGLLMGAPPDTTGLEQRLRRKRPQGPGGCVENPIGFVCRSCAIWL